MRKLLLLLFFLMPLTAAAQHENYPELILGDWIKTGDNSRGWRIELSHDNYEDGFAFYKDSLEIFNANLKEDSVYKPFSKKGYRPKKKFLGFFKKYRIEKDALIIEMLGKRTWDTLKIEYLDKDSLVIRRDSILQYNKRVYYNIDTAFKLNSILYSASVGFFSTSPVMDIRIDSNGDVYFYGYRYTKQIGFLKGRIDTLFFKFLETKLLKSEPLKQEKDYYSPSMHSPSYGFTYLYNDNRMKQVYFKGTAGPFALLWLAKYFYYLEDIVSLTPVHPNKLLFGEKFSLEYLDFKGKEHILTNDAAVFLLTSEIGRGIKTTEEFKEIYYFFPYYYNQDDAVIKSIATDGLYFKIYYKSGKSQSYKTTGFLKNYIKGLFQ